MSIKDATAAIRSSRQLKVTRKIGDDEVGWSIRSTSGERTYYLDADLGTMEITCTCTAGQSHKDCWHKERVMARLKARYWPAVVAQAPEVEAPAVPEPKKLPARAWGEIYREKLTVLQGGEEDSA